MKKIILLPVVILILLKLITAAEINGYECPEIETDASSFVLMEADTGQIITGKNENVKVPSGTLNKLMTALIAAESMESGMFSEETELTASENAHTAEGAVIWLNTGEKISVKELFKGLLIGNASDAAVVFAEKISGSCDDFTVLMNIRAEELGMKDTFFTSPYKTDDDNQYTTAADTARLASEISSHAQLHDIMTTWLDYVRSGKTEVANENVLVKNFDGITGVRAWHTEGAGWCAAASAERDGIRYVSAVLGCSDRDNRFSVAKKLLNTGFSGYRTVMPGFFPEHMKPVRVKKGTERAVLTGAEEIRAFVIPKGTEGNMSTLITEPIYIEAPVRKGQRIGTVAFYLDRTLLYETPLIAAESVQKNTFKKTFSRIIVKMFK